MREISEAWIAFFGRTTSRSVPSMRKRTTEICSNGSIWISDASSRNACVSNALIMRITGASSADSSKSSMAGMSIISLARSRSDSTSSITCAASPPEPAYACAIAASSSSRGIDFSFTRPKRRLTSAIAVGAVASDIHTSTVWFVPLFSAASVRRASSAKSRANA